jgi:acetylornithine aminotransferase/acetylornithine/N-succinyldiaminopimelate aminotransferase
LRGLRRLCDDHKLLLFMDEVQCGHFRTGRFQSFQRIFEEQTDSDFLPDGISMAKSLGGGFPMGAFWVRTPYADLLGPGSHGTTFGGSPLGCSVALKVLEVIPKEKLADNVRTVGEQLKNGLLDLRNKYPQVFQDVRGLGLMLGLQLHPEIANLPGDANKSAAVRFANLLHGAGMLTIPAGTHILRFLPPLNLRLGEVAEALGIMDSVAAGLGR